ncbi:MAG: sensor histidine kinase [Bacillota bacterium]|jgi:signal transduction histidine kinase
MTATSFRCCCSRRNRDLLEKQGYEVRLATLNERNRIAREIHDQVGHLLSRSILQVGAMLVMPRAATEHKQLVALRDTLTQAMNSIRRSVHDLHEESVDLRMQLLALVDSFLFCPLRLDYRLESEPDQQIKYCFLAIVKEGLHNIARHSNASQASLTLLEHPAFYQLILQDNGSSTAAKSGEGLGLKNMAERVAALGGQFSAGQQDGFRVFVSVPKRR